MEGRPSEVDIKSLPDADVISTGPSCVPFSRTGLQIGFNDSKSDAFKQILECIDDQARRKSSRLIAFIIENVLGFSDKVSGISPLKFTTDWLQDHVGELFEVWTWKLQARDHGLPQDPSCLFTVA